MATDPAQRPLVRTGRPLDESGSPRDGPALELHPDGAAAELLASSPNPLVSSPAAGVWATLLESPAGATGRPVLLQWLAPDADGPPPHVHPTAETFEVVAGEFTVAVEGESTRLAPGETATVQSGRVHTFRNDTDEVVAFRAEVPSMQTVRGLFTAWGLDHERAADGEYDGPGAIDSLLLAEDMADETEMTTVPVPVQRFLWATAGRAARAAGYTGIDKRFIRDAFWERHVEQPRL